MDTVVLGRRRHRCARDGCARRVSSRSHLGEGEGRSLLWSAVMLFVAGRWRFSRNRRDATGAGGPRSACRDHQPRWLRRLRAGTIRCWRCRRCGSSRARARGRGDDSGQPDGHLAESHLDRHRRAVPSSHSVLYNGWAVRGAEGERPVHGSARAEDGAGAGHHRLRRRASGRADDRGSRLGGDRECADDHVVVHRIFASPRDRWSGDDRRRA